MTHSRTPSAKRTDTRSAAPDAGARVIDLADPDWCWGQLAGATHGVLSSRCTGRAVALAVDYTMDDDELQIPIATDHELLHLLAGHTVTLGLTGRNDDGTRWVVHATGIPVLTLVTDAAALEADRRNHPAYDAGLPVRDDAMLVLPTDRLRGYSERPLGATTGAAAQAGESGHPRTDAAGDA